MFKMLSHHVIPSVTSPTKQTYQMLRQKPRQRGFILPAVCTRRVCLGLCQKVALPYQSWLSSLSFILERKKKIMAS